MALKQIRKRLFIEHNYLDNDIINHIYIKLCETTQDECDKEIGYILKINKNIKIIDMFSSPVNGDIIAIIDFEALTLKPETGQILKGIICMIFSNGIFVNVENKQKVLIPLTNLKEFKYDNQSKTFYDDNTVLKSGDIIEFIIEGVKYSKNSFNCFGRIKACV